MSRLLTCLEFQVELSFCGAGGGVVKRKLKQNQKGKHIAFKGLDLWIRQASERSVRQLQSIGDAKRGCNRK